MNLHLHPTTPNPGEIAAVLDQAIDRDTPGRFMQWLCKLEPLYGHILDGYWWDIGTIDQYFEAAEAFERLHRAGSDRRG